MCPGFGFAPTTHRLIKAIQAPRAPRDRKIAGSGVACAPSGPFLCAHRGPDPGVRAFWDCELTYVRIVIYSGAFGWEHRRIFAWGGDSCPVLRMRAARQKSNTAAIAEVPGIAASLHIHYMHRRRELE